VSKGKPYGEMQPGSTDQGEPQGHFISIVKRKGERGQRGMKPHYIVIKTKNEHRQRRRLHRAAPEVGGRGKTGLVNTFVLNIGRTELRGRSPEGGAGRLP